MGNLTSLLWQASISGEIHPAEEGLDSGESVLREWWVVPGGQWFCVLPFTSQSPFGGADAEQADVTVLALPLFTADHRSAWIV